MDSTEEHALQGLLLTLLAERDRRVQVNVNKYERLEISFDGFWISFHVGSNCEMTLTHSDQKIPYLAPDTFLHLVPEPGRKVLQRPNNVHSVMIKIGQFYMAFSTREPVWDMLLSTEGGICMKLILDKDKVAKLVQSFAVLRITQVFPDDANVTYVWSNSI